MTTITKTVEKQVLARLAEADGEGWVYAADLVPLIPAGAFWSTMDALRRSGRVVKRGYGAPSGEREPGHLIDNAHRVAFRLPERRA